MPLLSDVNDKDRKSIFDVVEKLNEDQLQKLGVWQKIRKQFKDPKLLFCDAGEYGVYFDPKSKKFVVLVDLSLKHNVDEYSEISATAIADVDKLGNIFIEEFAAG